jgi:hypothetical protein
MKAIKITEKKADAIVSALHDINGRATRHAYTEYREIEEVAKEAEAALDAIGLQRKHRAGAEYTSTSGESVPNAYQHSRIGTAVTLRRNTAGWQLVHIAQAKIYKEAGRAYLTLTRDQDAIVVANIRRHYRVSGKDAA